MDKKTVRVALDAMLTIMIVFEMFIQYTGDFLHEVVGLVFFLTIGVHLALSAKWMKSTAHTAKSGRLTARRAALAVMGCLLAIVSIALAVSSIAISNLLAQAGFAWPIGSYGAWVIVHAVSSYALCALVAIHLAMHWVFVVNALRIPYNPARRKAIGTGVHAVAALGAVALGISAVREALPQNVLTAIAGENSNQTAFSDVNDRAIDEGTGESNAADDSETTGNSTDNNAANGSSTGENASSGQNGSNGSSDEISTRGNQKRGRHGKHRHDVDDTEYSDYGNSTPTPDSQSENTSDSSTDGLSGQGNDSDLDDSSDSGYGSDYYDDDADDGASNVAGYCPLCHKNCPLSAPQCNRPYEAGLIQ